MDFAPEQNMQPGQSGAAAQPNPQELMQKIALMRSMQQGQRPQQPMQQAPQMPPMNR